jgi:hypothetical protein
MQHYGYEINRFCSKLMCLFKPVEVTDNSNKTLAYYGICSICTIHYEYVMFSTIGPGRVLQTFPICILMSGCNKLVRLSLRHFFPSLICVSKAMDKLKCSTQG